jgi:isopenicillin N synthase-like dioxygenase
MEKYCGMIDAQNSPLFSLPTNSPPRWHHRRSAILSASTETTPASTPKPRKASQGFGNMSEIPILDLSLADSPEQRPKLLTQLHNALFNVGFLYIKNHGVPETTVSNLTDLLPTLFNIPAESKNKVSKLNSPHFVGYNGFAEETTLGKKDLREQFDFATELPVVWEEKSSVNGREGEDGAEERGAERDFSKLFWRLRGPNLWPDESEVPGFRQAFSA